MNRRHGVKATAREVRDVTRCLGDCLRHILCQRVRGSVTAVRAVRNTRGFETDTGVVADPGCIPYPGCLSPEFTSAYKIAMKAHDLNGYKQYTASNIHLIKSSKEQRLFAMYGSSTHE